MTKPWLGRSLLLSCTSTIVFACGGSSGSGATTGESLGTVTSAVNGAPATESYAVGICTGESPSQCTFRCSGTLIAPNLVLTVRHCIYPVPRVHVDCANDTFGPNYIAEPGKFWATTNPTTSAATSTGWHRVRMFRVPTASVVCGADLALLVLDDSVAPSDALPATPALTPLIDRATFSTTVTIIGFGETAPGVRDFGTRRIRQSNPIVCLPDDPALACDSFGTEFREREFVANTGGCEGDSGSGAFEQLAFNRREPTIVGVLSRGLISEKACTGGIYQQLDKWGSFIAGGGKLAATIGGYEAPAWSNIPAADNLDPQASPYPRGTLGGPCIDSGECDTKLCASKDGGFNFTCSQPCGDGCPSGFTCVTGSASEQLCFPAAPSPQPPKKEPSCTIANAPTVSGALTREGTPTWLVAFAGLAILRRRSRAR